MLELLADEFAAGLPLRECRRDAAMQPQGPGQRANLRLGDLIEAFRLLWSVVWPVVHPPTITAKGESNSYKVKRRLAAAPPSLSDRRCRRADVSTRPLRGLHAIM